MSYLGTTGAYDAPSYTAAPAEDVSMRMCGCASCMKSAAAADAKNPGLTAIIGVAGDDVQDSATTPYSDLDANAGATVIKSIEHPGDVDYFRVTLTAGTKYLFNLTPENKGSQGPDLKVGLYAADGTLIEEMDGSGMGGAESIDFTAPSSGEYYVAVSGYLPIDTGVYSLSAAVDDSPPDPNAGTPLAAIDWGGVDNRVNTDGVETASGADVIHVYFSRVGEVYMGLGPAVAENWETYEKTAAFTAFTQYSNVLDVVFVEVNTREEADFVLVAAASAPVILGRMSPPGEADEGQGEFNTLGVGWDESGLQQGGYGYVTLIHEFGHGMGLAHPHDNGGGSEIMQGVEADTDPGVFNLNQGVFTTMSYRSGNPDGANGESPDNAYGYEGTLGAFDVALLQQKYGANTTFASGGNTYVLKDVNASGTFYSSIWDTGGIDTITYGGTKDSYIDLRAATLQYEEGGGGWVSYVDTIHGGFTIANGVTIERAISGAGADTLIGNEVANTLSSGAGDDTLRGNAGADVLSGGLGNDTLEGGDGTDAAFYVDIVGAVVVDLAAGTATGSGGVDTLDSIENARGSSFNDVISGDGGRNGLYGGAGIDRLNGLGGDDLLLGEAGSDILSGGEGEDTLTGGAGADVLDGGAGSDTASYSDVGAVTADLGSAAGQNTGGGGVDRFVSIENLTGGLGGDTLTGNGVANRLIGGGGDDVLAGGGAGDTLNGGVGDDRLEGGAGNDALDGGAGADTFVFGRLSGLDSVAGFASEDAIALRAASFGLAVAPFTASLLQFGSSAVGAAGVFLYDAASRTLSWDSDGAGASAKEAIAVFATAVTLTADDFVLI